MLTLQVVGIKRIMIQWLAYGDIITVMMGINRIKQKKWYAEHYEEIENSDSLRVFETDCEE